jgi:energy-coupling factor transporter ATP-binding protein EcfA2
MKDQAQQKINNIIKDFDDDQLLGFWNNKSKIFRETVSREIKFSLDTSNQRKSKVNSKQIQT